jgi:anti-sigma-K factor RskA
VSAGLEHRECIESLGAYALGALPDHEADRVRRHLAECHECRAELTWLRGAVDALPASVPPIDPPPELKRRLMEIVESEAELLRAAGEAADRPPAPVRQRRGWPIGLAGGLGLAAACAAAIVALVLVLTLAGGSGARVIRAEVLESRLAKSVQASLRVSGSRAELQVAGLPTPEADHVDELWVERGSASPQPAGTFVLESGSVRVQLPVRSGDVVLVTVEAGRGTSAPTTPPVIRARV